MKHVEEMTGIEKAAMFLIAIGAEVASRVMAYLDEKTVFKIAQEIVTIDDLTVKQKEDLMGEFLLDLKKNKNAVYGGENVARGMLVTAFGEEKAENIFNNITHIDIEKGFTFLKNIDPDILTSLLENEHPQTITATLYYLSPVQNAKILKNLPTFLTKDIIKRMAKIERPSPGAVLEIVHVLRNKYEKLRTSAIKAEKADGISTLIDIMSQMNPDQEKKLKEYLYLKLPAISDKIKERLFTFDAVINLTHREVQILIDEINDDYIIAKSLKGAGDTLRFKFLRNMSQNRATNILHEMDSMGPVRLSEINEARNNIVQIMRFLNDNGSIIIRKEQERLVE
jgi:flagellar motor switch protein FliG